MDLKDMLARRTQRACWPLAFNLWNSPPVQDRDEDARESATALLRGEGSA